MLYYSTNEKLDTVVSRRERQAKKQEYFNSLPPSEKMRYSRIGRSKEIYNSIDFQKMSNDIDWIASGERWMRHDLGISKYDVVDHRNTVAHKVLSKVNEYVNQYGMDYFDQGLLFVNMVAKLTKSDHQFNSHLKEPEWFGYSFNCVGFDQDPKDYFIPKVWNSIYTKKMKGGRR